MEKYIGKEWEEYPFEIPQPYEGECFRDYLEYIDGIYELQDSNDPIPILDFLESEVNVKRDVYILLYAARRYDVEKVVEFINKGASREAFYAEDEYNCKFTYYLTEEEIKKYGDLLLPFEPKPPRRY